MAASTELENLKDPVVVGDANGRILFANESFSSVITGNSRESRLLLGEDLIEHPAITEMLLLRFGSAAEFLFYRNHRQRREASRISRGRIARARPKVILGHAIG